MTMTTAQVRRQHMLAAYEKGRHTESEWLALVRTLPKECPHCGVKLDAFNSTKDHKVPVSRGGGDGLDNVERVCWECNTEKGTRTSDEFEYLGERPRPYSVAPWRRREWDRVMQMAAARRRRG